MECKQARARKVHVPLGQIVATPGALVALSRSGVTALDLLRRHQRGDWGDVPLEDAQLNDEAVVSGLRILSSYSLGDYQRLWIITEADRSVTTLLLPHDY